MKRIWQRPTVFAMMAAITGIFDVCSFFGLPPFSYGITAKLVAFLIFTLSLLRIIAMQRQHLLKLRDPKMTFLAQWFATPQTSSEGLPAIVQRVAITNDSSVVAEDCELVITEFSIAVPGLSMDTPLNIKDVDKRKGEINRRSTRHFDLFFTYQTAKSESSLHGTYVMAPNWPSIPWRDKEEVATIVLRLNGANFDPRSWKATVRLEDGKADIVEIKATSHKLD